MEYHLIIANWPMTFLTIYSCTCNQCSTRLLLSTHLYNIASFVCNQEIMKVQLLHLHTDKIALSCRLCRIFFHQDSMHSKWDCHLQLESFYISILLSENKISPIHVRNAETSFEIYSAAQCSDECHLPINFDNFLTYAWHFLEGPKDAKKAKF